MQLDLYREPSNSRCTPGKLFVDGQFYCYTLEDIVREIKIDGQTAIPAGRYRVIVNRSNRFKRDMPLLLNVPGFDGIRIHNGNTAEHTEGCILLGNTRDVTHVWGSIATFKKFFKELQEALKNEQVWISIHAAAEQAAA